MYGCGHHGYAGKAQHPYALGATSEPFNKTCPRYCMSLWPVATILDDIEDYRRGSFGNILDLEHQYLQCLRVADLERSRWQHEMDKQRG